MYERFASQVFKMVADGVSVSNVHRDAVLVVFCEEIGDTMQYLNKLLTLLPHDTLWTAYQVVADYGSSRPTEHEITTHQSNSILHHRPIKLQHLVFHFTHPTKLFNPHQLTCLPMPDT